MLIKKGAEANLYLEEWHGVKVVIKHRVSKRYRIPQLDSKIRHYRTVHETQLIHKAKKAGVPTPTIFMLDIAKSSIYMEFIKGEEVKKALNNISSEKRQRLCHHIGTLIGMLHNNGIIHGDLTTSNMILTPYDQVVFLDFGLGAQLKEIESRGVDLHLLKRAFKSIHYNYAEQSFKAVIDGYCRVVGAKELTRVLDKLSEIEKRGRYVSERKTKG